MAAARLAFAVTVALALAAAGAARALDVGDAAPALELPLADGTPRRLEADADHVLLVDFWASWCAPCRESLPHLDALHREHAAEGLRVVGVNLDEERAEAERFLERYPVAFAIVYDPAASSPERFGVKAMPSSYLIGRDGRVRAVFAGFRERDKARLRDAVREALAEVPP